MITSSDKKFDEDNPCSGSDNDENCESPESSDCSIFNNCTEYVQAVLPFIDDAVQSDEKVDSSSESSEEQCTLYLLVVDNDHGRVQEMRHRLENVFQDKGLIRIHEYTDREDALNSPVLATRNPIVFSDIGGHKKMPDTVDFIKGLKEVREDVIVVLYTGKNLETFFSDDDNQVLDPENPNSIIDAIVHRDNMVDDLTDVLSDCLLDPDKTNDTGDIFVKYDGVKRDAEELTSQHIITPESGLHMPIHTWVDDIDGDGKLGRRWDFVVGDHKIRLRASKLYIYNIIKEQMFMSGTAPSIYVPGAGEGIELIHMAKAYKKKYPEITLKGNELDPIVKARLNELIHMNGLTDQMEIESNKWQNLPNKLNGSFDIIYSSGNEIECLPSREDQRIVLSNFYRILRPGGRLSYDIRNIQTVKTHKDEIQRNGTVDFVNKTRIEDRPGYPIYNGSKILSYPLVCQDGKVWFNYAFINSRMHDERGDAVLTMLLSDLQYHLDLLNDTGFIVSEIHGDFKIKEKAKAGTTITTVSDEIMNCGAHFFEIVSIKPKI